MGKSGERAAVTILAIAVAAMFGGSCGAIGARARDDRFTLTSPDIASGGAIKNTQVLSGFGCKGGNISPALKWTGVPEETKSFAVTIYDPDAPTGSGWWHWIVYNIPAKATGLAGGAGDPKKKLLPPGSVQAVTDFGKAGYGGPCPPQGDKPHHYVMTLYALDVAKLDVPARASGAAIGYALHGHMLAKSIITGLYGRH